MAKTSENPDHTPILQRIRAVILEVQPKKLLPLVGGERQNMPKALPFRLDHYLELVNRSGRHLAPSKRRAIDENTPPILERLDIPPRHWLYLSRNFESRFKRLAGSAEAVRHACR
ncbi:hypothetical protein ACJJIQ_05910 [Microbulbifer sp. ANSA003]|uniref:hypothetical protein n=1 Tax=Microbulbifer sp. ANSA003 TaxID=3243360 RepID=UPI004043112E